MSIRPFRDIKRNKTKVISVGKVKIGGDNPISVQSMTNTLTTDVKATIDQIKKTEKILKNNKKIKFKNIMITKNVSKVSIIGVGMITTPGVTYRMFKAISRKKINILAISTSEIKISVLIQKKNIKSAVSALHKEFNLGVK